MFFMEEGGVAKRRPQGVVEVCSTHRARVSSLGQIVISFAYGESSANLYIHVRTVFLFTHIGIFHEYGRLTISAS